MPRLLTFILVLASGFGIGFFLISWTLKEHDASWPNGDVSFTFDPQRQFWNVNFGDEWQRRDDYRLWLVKGEGKIRIDLPNRPRGDITLAMKTLPAAAEADGQETEVSVNGTSLGALSPARSGSETARTALVLPHELAVRSRTLTVSFAAPPPSAGDDRRFAIVDLTLTDYFAPQMTGVVDICSREMIKGWAASDTGGAPVNISRNGRIVARIEEHHDRPDLPRHGYPRNAGFIYRFPTPPAEGDQVEAILPTGQKLRGKACKF